MSSIRSRLINVRSGADHTAKRRLNLNVQLYGGKADQLHQTGRSSETGRGGRRSRAAAVSQGLAAEYSRSPGELD